MDNETIIFSIISNVGMARSCFIEAIRMAKSGQFDQSSKLLSEGDEYYALGHDSHMSLIQQEAEGTGISPSLILIHAEDLLVSAETFQILANELIDVFRQIANKKN